MDNYKDKIDKLYHIFKKPFLLRFDRGFGKIFNKFFLLLNTIENYLFQSLLRMTLSL